MSDPDPHGFGKTYKNKIKPCPFCGRAPLVWGSGKELQGLMIHCVEDMCANPSVSFYEHEFALSIWNMRRTPAEQTNCDK